MKKHEIKIDFMQAFHEEGEVIATAKGGVDGKEFTANLLKESFREVPHWRIYYSAAETGEAVEVADRSVRTSLGRSLTEMAREIGILHF